LEMKSKNCQIHSPRSWNSFLSAWHAYCVLNTMCSASPLRVYSDVPSYSNDLIVPPPLQLAELGSDRSTQSQTRRATHSSITRGRVVAVATPRAWNNLALQLRTAAATHCFNKLMCSCGLLTVFQFCLQKFCSYCNFVRRPLLLNYVVRFLTF